jgi:hypothetical protein
MKRFIWVLSGSLFVGCVGLPTLPKDPLTFLTAVPNKMVVSVSPNHIERDGLPFHQGMFCRIHFFHNDEPMPLAVDGNIQIMAYDRAKNGDNPIPVGVYQINGEQLAKHKRKDFIGTSYVFWLPYEPEKPTDMIVSASFKPSRGEAFSSNPSTVHLMPLKQATSPGLGKPRTYQQYTVVPQSNTGDSQATAVKSIPLSQAQKFNAPNTPSAPVHSTGATPTSVIPPVTTEPSFEKPNEINLPSIEE